MPHRFAAVASGWASRLPRRIPSVGRFARTASARSAAVETEGPDFGVTVVRAGRQLVLAGEFDVAAVEPFTAAAASLTVGRRGDVTVDLSALQFIDAAGLGALVTLHNTLVRGGQALRLRHPAPHVTRVFEAGGLLPLLSPTGSTADRNELRV